MKFKNPKTGRIYDLRKGAILSGFCEGLACGDCPLWDKNTGESCVKEIYKTPHGVAHKMGYEVLEEDFVTWVRVCDNQVDVMGEQLSTSGLYQLQTLLTGKSFLIDGGQVKIITAKVEKQIITTKVEEQEWVMTLYALVAIEPTPGTKKLREALTSNSPPGFLVSYLAKSRICSICENSVFGGSKNDKCHHIVGQEYDGETCTAILSGVSEILDWGFEGWLESKYREGKVKMTKVENWVEKEDPMEDSPVESSPMEDKPLEDGFMENEEENIEQFKVELKQKPVRDWTLGELRKFCQNTQMCSQECPFVTLCDRSWETEVPGDWQLGSQFREQDQNDAHKVMEIFGCDGRLKRRGKVLLFNGTTINYRLFPGLADGEEVGLKEILE